MSEPEDNESQDDELELQALQRRLDDAFATTRPRRGFDDELLLRIQAKRPVRSRFSDLLAALNGSLRSVPAFPAAAVAAVLIVAVGIGLVGYSGLFAGHNSSAASAALGSADNVAPQAGPARAQGPFGALPQPSFAGGTASQAAPVGEPYAGISIPSPRLSLTITSAPVFRYDEPSTADADKFAAGLGAVLQGRPQGYLGYYQAANFTLWVRGTVSSSATPPEFYLMAGPSTSVSQASAFLADHKLIPQTMTAGGEGYTSGGLLEFTYWRQFDVPGYGPATLVDPSGNQYGVKVDQNGQQFVLASGVLPETLTSATYPIISPDQAAREAQAILGSRTASSPLPSPAFTQPTQLVYVLVPAGDHSFFEPAYLFGVTASGSTASVPNVLVPAIA